MTLWTDSNYTSGTLEGLFAALKITFVADIIFVLLMIDYDLDCFFNNKFRLIFRFIRISFSFLGLMRFSANNFLGLIFLG